MDPSPVGEFLTAGAADLICEELDDAVVNPVVVRFDGPLLALIAKAEEAPLLDCGPKQGIGFSVGSGVLLRMRSPRV